MKRNFNFSVLLLFLGAGIINIILYLFGLRFYGSFAAAAAASVILCIVLGFAAHSLPPPDNAKSYVSGVMMPFAALFALISAALICRNASDGDFFFFLISAAAATILSAVFFFCSAKRKWVKVLFAAALAAVLIPIFLMLMLYGTVFSDEYPQDAPSVGEKYFLHIAEGDAHIYGFRVPRSPDYCFDSHGGFIGDGEAVVRYDLTSDEARRIFSYASSSSVWAPIDDNAAFHLYGGAEGVYSDGCTYGKIPKIENGFYSLYDKQSKSFSFPDTEAHSYNYSVAVFDGADTLWIYTLDT